MPSRSVSLAIVVCWLATTGWLGYRDIWPALRTGQPPPFTIDLADEAQLRVLKNRWVILRPKGEEQTRIGKARTWVSYRAADDSFELHNETEDLSFTTLAVSVRVPRMTTVYRVRPDGTLRQMSADLDAKVRVVVSNLDIKATVTGEVRDGQFFSRGMIDAGSFGKHEAELTPVPVAQHGSVLNPLHPLNRIAGLRPGQQWRMPLVNPLADAVAESLASKLPALLPAMKRGPKFLNATVLAEPQTLVYDGKETTCLVIEYHDDDNDLAAKTWVRQSDGLVLRQEAAGFGDRVILQRE